MDQDGLHDTGKQRRGFSLDETFGSALPDRKQCQIPVLGERLFDLMDAGGCTRIDAQRRAQDLLGHQFEAMVAAAGEFELDGAGNLADVLWTSPAVLRDGTMTRALAWDRQCNPGLPPSGFLLMFADEVNSRAVYSRRASPLTVADGIDGNFIPGGPYLVLVECRPDPFGMVRAYRGFAQPVLGTSSFMPVRSGFERELLSVLLAVQERIEEGCASAVIDRRRSHCGFATAIGIATSAPGMPTRKAWVQCGPDGPDSATGTFCATPDSLLNGALVAWLLQHLL